MKVKLRSPLDPHHTQMPGYLFQMCHTSFSVPCNHPMRMLLQRNLPHIILVVIQNASDNMDNHLMAIPADHIVTVYIPVTVDEVIHEAMIEFAAVNDIPEIGFSR